MAAGSKIKATEVTISSNRRLLWQCNKGHEWEAMPNSRANDGRGCPYCSGRKVIIGETDLATVNPELAKQVSPNSKIKATDITKSSSKKVLWKCSKNHEWLAIVASRSNNTGCPYCSGRKVIVGETDLATVNPELAKQVSPDSKTKAEEITEGSAKKLLWRCGEGHDWMATVVDRSRGVSCPYCSNQKVLPGFNDLATVNPELAKQVSPDSRIKAEDVTAGSEKKILWRCSKGHEWLARAYSRSNGNDCPKCSGSKMEENLVQLIKSLLPEHMKILRNDRKVIRPYELDILVPSLDLAFEFNGTYWHSDKMIRARRSSFPSSKAFDDFKKAECAKQGVKLFFVREKPWTESHEKEVKRVEKIVAAALKKAA